jgi:hypothetical protein
MTYSRKNMGSVSTAASGTETINNVGSSLNKGTPIAINSVTGNFDLVDVSSESLSRSTFAVVFQDTDVLGILNLITSGKIENLSISANFGDVIYVSKTGSLTNIAPAVGVGSFVSKDWVIVVGVIAKNINNPLLKDLYVNIDVKGQLE